MAKTLVVVKLQVEGLHYWGNCDIVTVEYLKDLHRHTFFIRAEKEVSHDDRDVEIIMFKRTIESYLKNKYHDSLYNCLNFEGMSCESIAKEIYYNFDCKSVEVLEDNENGAIVC